MARVYVPTSWRKLTGGQSHLILPARDLGGLVDALEERFPGFRRELESLGGYDTKGAGDRQL